MAQDNSELRVLIAASGTGGHLFPAVDIARALQQQNAAVKVEFIGSGRPLEAAIVESAGFRRHVIATVGVKQRGLRGAARFLATLPRAIFQTWTLLSRFEPQVVVGVGGYVSVIPVTVARLCGIPTWIHEAERRPGLANWLLSRYTNKISIAFADAEIPCRKKSVYTGQPVRQVFRDIAAEERRVDRPQRLLITGGSQGARALDDAIRGLLPTLKRHGIAVRHQCRAENSGSLRADYAQAGIEAEVFDFIPDLPGAYRWCDIVVARSGAGTTMELGVVNRPAVLVPFPHAQGQHQLRNAQVLAEAGKALIVEEGPGFPERLQEALSRVLDARVYAEMRSAPYRSRSLDAADAIARGCVELAGQAGYDPPRNAKT